ncbi:hypothetical protein PVK06_001441 [Gossypium arboreum]|uniref:Retrovirus-related Pol polyprotein from transposon TNT 1-94 n=1 Tax=Gossypium arboreum TaxID=29729 RepID=A0ABR0R2C3_GOSAR|nr:hypothetical protein PVK06_001441 [Gossypium arboreum]
MVTNNTQATLPNTHKPNSPLTLITIHNSIKLTPTNYLSWKTQIDFIPATITVNNAISPNLVYQTWLRQDKLLFAALVGTISPNLVPLITQSTMFREAWQALANTYALPSRGHFKQIKDNLKNISKGSQSVTDYMQAIKVKANKLATLGKPLDHEDLIEKVLDYLDDSNLLLMKSIAATRSSHLMNSMKKSLTKSCPYTIHHLY